MRRREVAALLLLGLGGVACGTDVEIGLGSRDTRPADQVRDDIRNSRVFDAPPFRASQLEPDDDPPSLTATEDEDDPTAVAVEAAEVMAGFGIRWLTATCTDGSTLALAGVDETDELVRERLEVELEAQEGTVTARVVAPPYELPVPEPELEDCPSVVRARVEALLTA